MLETLALVCFC